MHGASDESQAAVPIPTSATSELTAWARRSTTIDQFGAGGPSPPTSFAWHRLTIAVGFGVGVATVVLVTGGVVTYVRYEALAGIGREALVAAEKGDLFVTGVTSLLGVALLGLLLALGIGGVIWWQSRPSYGRLLHALRRVRRGLTPMWEFVQRHPWRTHLVVPAAVLVLTKWVLPDALGIPLGILAVLSLLAGALRGFAAIADKAATGEGRWARRARIPMFLLLAAALPFVTYSWVAVATFVVGALFVPFAMARTRGLRDDEVTPRYFLVNERGLTAAFLITWLLASAVAGEADRPTGLTVAKVTPVQGRAFEAFPLGQHSGRAVFLDDRHLNPSGVIELAPGNLRSVVVIRSRVLGRTNRHAFAKRLADWASQPVWTLK